MFSGAPTVLTIQGIFEFTMSVKLLGLLSYLDHKKLAKLFVESELAMLTIFFLLMCAILEMSVEKLAPFNCCLFYLNKSENQMMKLYKCCSFLSEQINMQKVNI